jgi:hypothetical protein
VNIIINQIFQLLQSQTTTDLLAEQAASLRRVSGLVRAAADGKAFEWWDRKEEEQRKNVDGGDQTDFVFRAAAPVRHRPMPRPYFYENDDDDMNYSGSGDDEDWQDEEDVWGSGDDGLEGSGEGCIDGDCDAESTVKPGPAPEKRPSQPAPDTPDIIIVEDSQPKVPSTTTTPPHAGATAPAGPSSALSMFVLAVTLAQMFNAAI